MFLSGVITVFIATATPQQPLCAPAGITDSMTDAARVAACREQIRLHPADPYPYVALSTFLQTPAARFAILDSGRRVHPNDFFLQENAAYALRDLGRPEEAIDALERAARLDPKDATALTEAGLIAASMGQHDRAVRFYSRATARGSVDPVTWGYLARSEAALGRDADAVRHWDRAEAESPRGYLDEAGDRGEYAQSLARAPKAHVVPSQAGPTARFVGTLALALAALAAVTWLALHLWRAPGPSGLTRLLLAVTIAHWGLTWILLVTMIGVSFGVNNGAPILAVQRPVLAVAPLFLEPLASVRALAPVKYRPTFSAPMTLANSVAIAALIVGIVALWRRRRFTRAPA